MTLYERIADLPLHIEEYSLERHERETSSDFTRATTVVSLFSDDAVGQGEDVTYELEEHDALRDTDPEWDLAGEYTMKSFSAALDNIDLFFGRDPGETFRHYRRWAFESAALDLALRQSKTNLGQVLDRRYDPVRFVISTRLGDSPATERIETWLDHYPDAEFKLDPTPDWTADVIEDLVATGAVRTLDLKGFYEGSGVDNPADPDLYRRIIDGFPEAVIEDPRLTDDTSELFAGEEGRVSWDYPITGVESIESLPFEPRWLNIKPSRFGTVESVLDSIEYCLERDIHCYGGGQFELGVGREHIQTLASLFYPDSPNDVAPSEYNAPEPRADLPESPLVAPAAPAGLGFVEEDAP
ncbi:MAG TPA: hypothetical protein VFJ06_11675 [Halococcus sp.]|nr:hypothetical protein [Halococcus sp.]